MRFTMSTDERKDSTDVPATVEVVSVPPVKKSRKTLILVVAGVIVLVLVLAAILIGMYMFTEAQKNLIQQTMKLRPDVTQETTIDKSANVVEYHVTSPGIDVWMIVDFNTNVEVAKLTSSSGINCYANPLNGSISVDLSKVDQPPSFNSTDGPTIYYAAAKTPIPDTSFLSKKAKTMCSGIPIYWVYPVPSCGNKDGLSIQKRGVCSKVCSWVCHWWAGCKKRCWLADVACTIWSWFG